MQEEKSKDVPPAFVLKCTVRFYWGSPFVILFVILMSLRCFHRDHLYLKGRPFLFKIHANPPIFIRVIFFFFFQCQLLVFSVLSFGLAAYFFLLLIIFLLIFDFYVFWCILCLYEVFKFYMNDFIFAFWSVPCCLIWCLSGIYLFSLFISSHKTCIYTMGKVRFY